MKKIYLQPQVFVAHLETVSFVCDSKSVKTTLPNGDELGYGGVDEDGSKDPSSRRRHRYDWDDEEEEEEW